MVLSYLHIFKKLYLKNYVTSESDGWMLGGYAFLWFHYIIFLGISLSCSHLSDLTLTIGANIFYLYLIMFIKLIILCSQINTSTLIN
jgi:hypothetical protein